MEASNNSNANSAAVMTPQRGQKVRITIKPKSGGISITLVPGEGPAVVHNEGQRNRPAHSKRIRPWVLTPNQEFASPQCPPSNPETSLEQPEDSAPMPFPYATELEQLKSEGYRCNWWLEKLLILNNGNLEETRQILNKKKAKKEAIREQYAAQLSQLHDAGFKHDCINLRLLKKYNGDLEQTLNKLLDCQDKLSKLFASRARSQEELEAKKAQYKDQLDLLHQGGFNRDRFLVCLLDRFDGNVEAVLTKLNKKKLRSETKMAPFHSQLEQLRLAGHCQDRINYRLLKATSGDVEKVLRVLNHSKSRHCKRRESNRDATTTSPTSPSSSSSSTVEVAADESSVINSVSSTPDMSGPASSFPHGCRPPFHSAGGHFSTHRRGFEHGRPMKFPASDRSGAACFQAVQNMPAFAGAHSVFGTPFPQQALGTPACSAYPTRPSHAGMGGPQFAQGRPQPPMRPPFAGRPVPM